MATICTSFLVQIHTIGFHQKKIMLNISVEDNNQLKALHVSYPETELGQTRFHQGIGRYLYANVCHHWRTAGRAL